MYSTRSERYNPILDADSYKASHPFQLPPGARGLFAYSEARGGPYELQVFGGFQIYLMEYLSRRVTMDHVNYAAEFHRAHGVPYDYDGFKRIATRHGGRWPVEIKAPKEGTLMPVHNATTTIESTDDELPWVPSYLETQKLRADWYATTIATYGTQVKAILLKYLKETGCDPKAMDATANFMLNDFGARGASSLETADIGGMMHFFNFMGSDNMHAIDEARHFYDAPMAAFSIPASEHSTITSWGRENEYRAFDNMLEKFGVKQHSSDPDPIVACVSDSYNIYEAVKYWISIKDRLEELHRLYGTRLVVRPDSGDPRIVPIEVIEMLMEGLGFTVNAAGYKVLPPYVRVIQGDGVDEHSIIDILESMKQKKIAAENIVFGSGGALLQKFNRDTMSWANKCSSIRIGNEWRDVFKNPIHGSKKSMPGRLALVEEVVRGEGTDWSTPPVIHTVRQEDIGDHRDLLDVVYRNGQIMRHQNLEDIRKLINGQLLIGHTDLRVAA